MIDISVYATRASLIDLDPRPFSIHAVTLLENRLKGLIFGVHRNSYLDLTRKDSEDKLYLIFPYN